MVQISNKLPTLKTYKQGARVRTKAGKVAYVLEDCERVAVVPVRFLDDSTAIIPTRFILEEKN